jgi:ABC-type lipoprotein release transport system permease subunit
MWRLAWRNLWRNRARTIITGTAIAFTLGIQLMSYGIAESSYEKMRSSAVKSVGGALLVHADGYWETLETDKVITESAAVVDAIRAVDGVDQVIPRIVAQGLVSSARGNAGTRLMAVERESTLAFDNPAKFLVEGTFLEERAKDLRLRGPLVLGKSVVDDLKIELGDRLVVAVTGPDGDPVRMPFKLTGIMDTGSEMGDAVAAYTSLDFVREQLVIPAGAVQLGVVTTSNESLPRVQAAVREALASLKQPLEVLRWDEANPELVKVIEADKNFGDKFGLLLFIIVGFGITNTFLMMVLERVRELGLLAALGLTPMRIATMVLVESIVLGLLSVFFGILIGYAGHLTVAHYGINYGEMVGGEIQMAGVVMEDFILYSHLNVARWIQACVVVLVMVVLAATYPALKATRMEPATAMRTYE